MNTRPSNMDKTLGKAISLSLVIAGYVGNSVLDVCAQAAEEPSTVSVEMIQTAAAEGDVEALYWLAMMHIEGTITGADYERGMELLKTASRRGNKDAERMYAFMDNAFSGEGC